MITKIKTEEQLNEYGRWLETLPREEDGHTWDYFFTITAPAGEHRTARAWRRSMIREFNGLIGGQWEIFTGIWALERHKSGEIHVHGLLQLKDSLNLYMNDESQNEKELIATWLWQKWFERYGRNQVIVYDPQLGATHYVSKYCLGGMAKASSYVDDITGETIEVDTEIDWDFIFQGEKFLA
ncbi:hypothetical protein F4X90_17350 [Candidatus Poribacteria bacterium]|nr:hypothetical protein [Candidatus Poribacteria bacterium]